MEEAWGAAATGLGTRDIGSSRVMVLVKLESCVLRHQPLVCSLRRPLGHTTDLVAASGTAHADCLL